MGLSDSTYNTEKNFSDVVNVNYEIAIILPTYNEGNTIGHLIAKLESLNLNLYIIVVDDSSSDGTQNIVKDLKLTYSNIELISRSSKNGKASAIREGFNFILSKPNASDFIITMDTDFSHNPNDIPRLLSAAKNNDIVIGSRYCKGGGVINWSLLRVLFSRTANLMTSALIESHVHDYRSRFRCYSRAFVKAIQSSLPEESNGIQEETIRIASMNGFKIKEVPIISIKRSGSSKTSFAELNEFLSYAFSLLVSRDPSNSRNTSETGFKNTFQSVNNSIEEILDHIIIGKRIVVLIRKRLQFFSTLFRN